MLYSHTSVNEKKHLMKEHALQKKRRRRPYQYQPGQKITYLPSEQLYGEPLGKWVGVAVQDGAGRICTLFCILHERYLACVSKHDY